MINVEILKNQTRGDMPIAFWGNRDIKRGVRMEQISQAVWGLQSESQAVWGQVHLPPQQVVSRHLAAQGRA